jgi:lactoylglutathione lyase
VVSCAVRADDVVREFLARAEQRLDSAYDLVAVDLVQHAAGPQGRDGLRLTLGVVDHDLDRPRPEVHHLFAVEDLVTVHLTLHGTHVASTMPLLAGVPVTNRAVAWTYIHIWRVSDGLIAEHWACRDDVGLLAQVGAWPR